jgi:hypothetical protein
MNEVKFQDKDFDVLRKFQNKMNAVFGDSAYVGTTYAMVQLEYSPALNAMIRPYPPEKHFEFVIKLLACEDCKRTLLFLALPQEEKYVCFDCLTKRHKKGK